MINNNNDIRFKLAINKHIVNKNGLEQYNSCFENTSFNCDQLIAHINQGLTFTAELKSNSRKKANFESAQIIGLDFDNLTNLDDFINDHRVKQYASFIHTTSSHLQNGNNARIRMISVLESSISNTEDYEDLLRILLKIFPEADSSCKDATRAWFGAKDCQIYRIGNVLSNALKQKLFINKALLLKQKMDSKALTLNTGSYTKEQVEEILSYIDPQPGYEIWRNVVWIIGKYFSHDEAKDIIEKWSPDYKHNGEEIDKLLRLNDGRIGIDKLLSYAESNGYKRPEELRKKSSAGQLAYAAIFKNGNGYASNGDILFEYKDGFYNELEYHKVKQSITNYFDQINTFANSKSVKEALSWVISKCYISPEKFNPPGINLLNCSLLLSYNQAGKPIFSITEHSPDNYFTFKADFNYDPTISSEKVLAILLEMLSKEEIDILLKNISASFDIARVRKADARLLRAIILSGTGSNGKDTVREWLSHLYSDNSMTSVPLQTFKSVDSDKFGLESLITSRINWASENKAITLDQCQTLKAFITGDRTPINVKHQSHVTITPEIALLFNVNELPFVSSLKEATLSRFCIIRFPYEFKSKPNPNNPNEKQANPRLKEDKEYIGKEILPAFLNLLIESFKDLIDNGIDYSFIDHRLQELGEDCSHLLRFVKENQLCECPLECGLESKDLYQLYLEYCLGEGLASKNSWNTISYIDDSYDPVARNQQSLTKKLMHLFPNLKRGKINDKRVIGISKPLSLSPQDRKFLN